MKQEEKSKLEDIIMNLVLLCLIQTEMKDTLSIFQHLVLIGADIGYKDVERALSALEEIGIIYRIHSVPYDEWWLNDFCCEKNTLTQILLKLERLKNEK